MRQVVDSQVGDVRQSPVQLGLDAPEAVVVVHVEVILVLFLNGVKSG